MGKLFKISGSFEKKGKWSEPVPAFVGEILMQDDHLFIGYCDELHNGKKKPDDTIRYLVGSFIDRRDDNKGIEFYKMSNDPAFAPILYTVKNLTNEETGIWGAYFDENGSFCFYPHGQAKVTVEEQPCNKRAAERVKARFEELKKDLYWNNELITAVLA
jgi:hypothetical protein